MDSGRKRFRSDISDEYVRKMFDKSRRKRKQGGENIAKVASENSPSIKPIMTCIPSELLPCNKNAAITRQRDIAKPENWLMPKESKAPSRSQVFELEKTNITKKVKEQEDWRRAAKTLNIAIKKRQSTSTCRPIIPDEDDDRDRFSAQSDTATKDPSQVVRKNHSREFLQKFFKKASLIEAEEKVARKCS